MWAGARQSVAELEEADLEHLASDGETRLPLPRALEGGRGQRPVERPRSVEPADQTGRGLVELCGEGHSGIEPKRQALRLPGAPRESRVLCDDGVVDDP